MATRRHGSPSGHVAGDPTPETAASRVEQMIAVGYRRRGDGVEDPNDTRVYWSLTQITGMSRLAFDAVLARKRKR
jgi:hypothetical protein